jgi:hypothetical protein
MPFHGLKQLLRPLKQSRIERDTFRNDGDAPRRGFLAKSPVRKCGTDIAAIQEQKDAASLTGNVLLD